MAAIVRIDSVERPWLVADARHGTASAKHIAAEAATAERERIALDLHDSLGQSLKGIGLCLAMHAADAAEPALRGVFEELLSLVEQADLELRLVIAGLLLERSADEDMASALARRCDEAAARSGLRVRFDVIGSPRPLGVAAERALVRVTAEALANVERHAQATSAEVQLVYAEEAVSLTVRDDGIGWRGRSPECVPGRFGIATMRRRMESVGGRVVLRRAQPRGVLVEAVIPGRKVTAHATGSGGGRR